MTDSFRYPPIKLSRLRTTHPKLDLNRVRILHALYRGGHHLLGDDAVMKEVMPRYSYEKDPSYQDRKKRAFCENLFAMVVNQVSAGLAQDPVRLAHAEDQVADPDEYWVDIMEDADAPVQIGGGHRSFDQIMRDSVVEALTTGRAWVQADLPPAPGDDREYTTLLEQEQDGGLRSYLCSWSTTHVTDWENDDQGGLLWVRTYECLAKAPTPDVDRAVSQTHRWTIWDEQGWTRYDIVVNKDNPMPNDVTLIPPTSKGEHSFGATPWVMLDLCGGGGRTHLHLGDMLESLCRAHLNRTNGEMYQWTQYNFQQMYEFLAPEIGGVDTPVGENQADPNRAHREARAPGAVHVRGHEDRAEFVGPDMGGAATGIQAVQDLRDAVLRVTQQMALSQDTSGAMLRRSADSKQQDAVAQEIVLGAIGKRLLMFARQCLKLLALGRGDAIEDVPSVEGYERFNVTDIDDVINQSVLVSAINIPSATYKVEELYRLAITHLGDGTAEKTRQKIRDELESALTQDQLVNMMQPPQLPDPADEEDATKEDDAGDGGKNEGDKGPPIPPSVPNNPFKNKGAS